MMNVKDYCKKSYNKIFEDELSKGKTESSAQKTAIRDTLIQSIREFSEEEPASLWKEIYSSHIHRKSKISDPAIVKAVLSAENSWKKSSGHAFEEMTCKEINRVLENTNYQLCLQRDISTLLKQKKIANSPHDIAEITKYLEKSTFDLFFIVNISGKKFLFGCVQTKTSIRDRVTRDREPSIIAMNHNFWSIAIVLDGQFLQMPKFRDMVNGEGSGFESNGWHGLYAFSLSLPENRIYRLDSNLKPLVEHVKIAADFWNEKRQWMDSKWNVNNASNF